MSETPESMHETAGSMSERPSTTPCPICQKGLRLEYRPFCSKRCADVDLNRWLTGSYAIPVAEDDDEDGEDEAREGARPA
jgi:uncharacterized protein